jgi:plasmid stabilization system protein ParE
MIVEWTENAAGQLIALRDSIARTSPAYAQALAEGITARTRDLVDHPRIGAEVPEYADETIREIYHHPFRILYRVDNEKVQIVAVIHAARQLPRSPPG